MAGLCGLIASAASILRHGDDVYWPRFLKFTILGRQKPHALFKLRQSTLVPVVVGVLQKLLAQYEPWVDAQRDRLRRGLLEPQRILCLEIRHEGFNANLYRFPINGILKVVLIPTCVSESVELSVEFALTVAFKLTGQ